MIRYRGKIDTFLWLKNDELEAMNRAGKGTYFADEVFC